MLLVKTYLFNRNVRRSILVWESAPTLSFLRKQSPGFPQPTLALASEAGSAQEKLHQFPPFR
ncbi:MAG TPA: hypothetical protein PK777_15530, partial [Thermoguttaceae bacterium]|nr:hypothetical protein [Thermoguttaceae bacterium]